MFSTGSLNKKFKKPNRPLKSGLFVTGGGKRTRTADPLHAMQVLYQLSYTPWTHFNVTYPRMSVDQIKENISYLFKLGFVSCLLSACPQQAIQKGLEPYKNSRLQTQELAYEPPLPLKQLGNEALPELKVLASLSSIDRSGYRRLQIYLFYSQAPEQAGYWRIIERYRNQYDVIWIYISSEPDAVKGLNQKHLHAQAAWFAPELPVSMHYPGFKPSHHHDGLYWTNAR
jgi:hypothetical protein